MSSWKIDEDLLRGVLREWKAEHHPDFMGRMAVSRHIRWIRRDPTGYGSPHPRDDYVWLADTGQGWVIWYVVHPAGVISVTAIAPFAGD